MEKIGKSALLHVIVSDTIPIRKDFPPGTAAEVRTCPLSLPTTLFTLTSPAYESSFLASHPLETRTPPPSPQGGADISHFQNTCPPSPPLPPPIRQATPRCLAHTYDSVSVP